VTLALAGVGGLLALLICGGCGISGYFLFLSGPPIAGQWHLVEPQLDVRVAITFRKNGTGVIEGPAADVHFDYRISDKEPFDLEWTITRVDSKNRPVLGPGFGKFNRPIGFLGNNQNLVGMVERFRVTVENDTMTTAPNNGGVPLKWQRGR